MCADAEALLPLGAPRRRGVLRAVGPGLGGRLPGRPQPRLPTFGSARFAGGLSVDDFVRTIHAITLDEAALAAVAPAVAALAEAEGLAAHADSVRLRTWAGS